MNPLESFSDAELLNELKTRKRLRTLSISRMFYAHLASAENYLVGIEADLARLIGKKILDDKLVVLSNHDGKMPDVSDPMIIRSADLMLIVPLPEPEAIPEAIPEVKPEVKPKVKPKAKAE
jgi:hypothetical protein